LLFEKHQNPDEELQKRTDLICNILHYLELYMPLFSSAISSRPHQISNRFYRLYSSPTPISSRCASWPMDFEHSSSCTFPSHSVHQRQQAQLSYHVSLLSFLTQFWLYSSTALRFCLDVSTFAQAQAAHRPNPKPLM
jgi:hypothetical protein